MQKKNRLVSINLAANFEVEDENGEKHMYKCAAINTDDRPPEKVIKLIEDCIKNKIAETSSKVR